MDPQPDLLFGKLAVKAGYLTEDQVQDLVHQQAEASRAGVPMSLGELSQMKRLLTSQQVQRILLAQEFHNLREEDRRLGQLALKNGFASEEEVGLALDEQKRLYQEEQRLPKRLGAILVEMGTLSQQQLDALLKVQARLGVQTSTRTIASPAGPPTATSPSDSLPTTTPSGEEVTAWLIQEAGEGEGRVFPLGRKGLIGRQATNEVPIADKAASRQHARIEFISLARQHVLSDLNSRHGTLLNGKPVTEPVALNPGDRIEIADTVLRYQPGSGVQSGFIPPGATMAEPVRLDRQTHLDTAEMPTPAALRQRARDSNTRSSTRSSIRAVAPPVSAEPSPAPMRAPSTERDGPPSRRSVEPPASDADPSHDDEAGSPDDLVPMSEIVDLDEHGENGHLGESEPTSTTSEGSHRSRRGRLFRSGESGGLKLDLARWDSGGRLIFASACAAGIIALFLAPAGWYFGLYLLVAAWVFRDAFKRRDNIVAWPLASAVLGPIVVPAYLTYRYLQSGELREGGRGWNLLKYFALLWTVTMLAAGIGGVGAASEVAQSASTDAERAGAAIGMGLGVAVLFMIWFFPVLGALVLGLLLKQSTSIERGPTGPLAEDAPDPSDDAHEEESQRFRHRGRRR